MKDKRKKDDIRTKSVLRKRSKTLFEKALEEVILDEDREYRLRAARTASWIQEKENLNDKTTNDIYELLLSEIKKDNDPIDISAYEHLQHLTTKELKTGHVLRVHTYQQKVVELLMRHQKEYIMSMLMIVANSYPSEVLDTYTAFVNSMKKVDAKRYGASNNTTKITKRKNK
jgi:hypothetical protein